MNIIARVRQRGLGVSRGCCWRHAQSNNTVQAARIVLHLMKYNYACGTHTHTHIAKPHFQPVALANVVSDSTNGGDFLLLFRLMEDTSSPHKSRRTDD